MKFTFTEQFGKHLFLSLFRVLEYKLLKLLEMQDWLYSHFGRQAVSYKAKLSLTLRSSDHTPRYLSKRAENACPILNEPLFQITKNWK